MIKYHRHALENIFEARTIRKDSLSISVYYTSQFFYWWNFKLWWNCMLPRFLGLIFTWACLLSSKRTHILGSLSSRVLEIKFTELLLSHHFSLSCICLRFNLSAIYSQYVLVAYPGAIAVTYPESKRLVFSLGYVVVNRFQK